MESTLAQIFKRRDEDGGSFGGPSYYIESGLGQRWLGIIFAVIIILTYAVGYNALASYNLQSSFAGFSFYGKSTPVVIGAMLSMGLAWDTADLLQALMVIINVPVILLLGKPAIACLNDYCRQRKEGKDPEFKAKDINLKYNTDFWN